LVARRASTKLPSSRPTARILFDEMQADCGSPTDDPGEDFSSRRAIHPSFFGRSSDVHS
jgi:hypothetical protein